MTLDQMKELVAATLADAESARSHYYTPVVFVSANITTFGAIAASRTADPLVFHRYYAVRSFDKTGVSLHEARLGLRSCSQPCKSNPGACTNNYTKDLESKIITAGIAAVAKTRSAQSILVIERPSDLCRFSPTNMFGLADHRLALVSVADVTELDPKEQVLFVRELATAMGGVFNEQ